MSITHEKTLAELFNDLIPEGGWVWWGGYYLGNFEYKKLNIWRFRPCVLAGTVYGDSRIFTQADYDYNVHNPIPENEAIRAREKLAGNMPDPSELEILKARVEDLKEDLRVVNDQYAANESAWIEQKKELMGQLSDALNTITELHKYKESYESADARWREEKEWNELLVQQHDRLLSEKEVLSSVIALLCKK